MYISIEITNSFENHSMVVIADNTTNFASLNLFSTQEIEYIQRKKKNDQKLISINQYNRHLFVLINNQQKEEDFKYHETLRKSGFNVSKLMNELKVNSAVITDQTASNSSSKYIAEGIVLSNYQYLTYKTKPENNSLSKLSIHQDSINGTDLLNLNAVLKGTFICRDLVNDHNGHLTSTQLSKEIKKLSKEAGFTVEILEKSKIEALKMGGLLAVNRASEYDPTFNIMEWKPENAVNKKPIVLVGKGVVYDTGGLSLKPTPNSMDFMKSDMAGAGAVIGVITSVSLAKLPIHIIALVAATDNNIGAKAYAPGEVITMHDGTTVEVLNTDAEGRLTLADALSYAKQYEPELVLDIATLTGAAARAIGKEAIVFMGKADDKTKNALINSGENIFERLVEFPIWEEYGEQIKSDIADLKNLGGDSGGAITAGKFLEHFTNYPWYHFDIAGSAYIHSPDNYRGKNGTGAGVRLFFNFLENYDNGK